MTGDQLAAWRNKQGLTLKEVGDLVGVHLSTIWRWEQNGDKHLRKPIAAALRQAMKDGKNRD